MLWGLASCEVLEFFYVSKVWLEGGVTRQVLVLAVVGLFIVFELLEASCQAIEISRRKYRLG